MKKKPFPVYDGDIIVFKEKKNGVNRYGTFLSQCEIEGFDELEELQLSVVVMGDDLTYRYWSEITPGQIARFIMRDDALSSLERHKITEDAISVLDGMVRKYALC